MRFTWEKIYSTENNKLTIGYKMLLCLGLVLLTAGNIQPRFRLVNRAVLSREPHGFVLWTTRAFTRSALAVHACQCAYGFRRYCTLKEVSLPNMKDFQKLEKLEALYGYGGCHLRIRDICMEFDLLVVTARLLCNETTKLGRLANFYVIFLSMGFISSYDAYWTMCKLGPSPFMNFETGNSKGLGNLQVCR